MTVKIASTPAAAPRPALGTALSRAFSGKCPSCGRGRLFASYLKQVKSCAECGEAFGHIRSDDAAPWLTILVVGHILVPIVLMVESRTTWPIWVSMALWLPITLGLTLAVLPKAKALFLGMIWATKAPGSEAD
jgi:uncharacterized protein (DUF983 family)